LSLQRFLPRSFDRISALCKNQNEFLKVLNKNMIGAIIGDTVGSVYEFDNIKTTEFPLFDERSEYTDDTVLTVAVADWLLHGGDLVEIFRRYGKKYPYPLGGYGGSFKNWLRSKNPQPYNSWGNGSAMRVCPVGWAFDTLEATLQKAKESAEITHNHSEGIKGAQATAAAIFLARMGKSKEEIRAYIEATFDYNLDRSCDDIRPDYEFDPSCQGTVPEALIAFFDSSDFESAIRLAVSLGGDSDTLACITGGIAEAYYREIPKTVLSEVKKRLPRNFKSVINAFYSTLIIKTSNTR
jgi:ADP-ribosylglycohydrolase